MDREDTPSYTRWQASWLSAITGTPGNTNEYHPFIDLRTNVKQSPKSVQYIDANIIRRGYD